VREAPAEQQALELAREPGRSTERVPERKFRAMAELLPRARAEQPARQWAAPREQRRRALAVREAPIRSKLAPEPEGEEEVLQEQVQQA